MLAKIMMLTVGLINIRRSKNFGDNRTRSMNKVTTRLKNNSGDYFEDKDDKDEDHQNHFGYEV